MTRNIKRGRDIRRAIRAVARASRQLECAFPPHAAIARSVGISAPQITRHYNRLLDQGAFTVRQQGRAIYIEDMPA